MKFRCDRDDLSEAAGVLLAAKVHVAGIVMDRTMGELTSRRAAPATAYAAPQVHPLPPRAGAAAGAEGPGDTPNGRPTPYPRAERPGDASNGRATPYSPEGLVGAMSSPGQEGPRVLVRDVDGPTRSNRSNGSKGGT